MPDGDRLAQRVEYAAGDSPRIPRIGDTGQQERELVSAQTRDGGDFIGARTRDRIAEAHAAGQPFGHLPQKLIAAAVTQRVVDAFEAVEIDEAGRDQLILPASVQERWSRAASA